MSFTSTTKLILWIKANPKESSIFFFLLLFLLLPLRCPNNLPYDYVPLTELDDDLKYCNIKDIRKDDDLPYCVEIPDHVDHFVKVNRHFVNESQFQKLAVDLNIGAGGKWKPSQCKSHYHVAIIIPNRGRNDQLKILLNHLHPFLQKQLIDYQIFVVEQTEENLFNKGVLFNAAYLEALKTLDFCCFILNDVDLLPENLRNLYTCSKQPRHMCSNLDTFRYVLPYTNIFGGVVSISKDQFETVNGFSNEFWGWGGEDDDFMNRVKAKDFKITRWEPSVSRYTMLFHPKETKNPMTEKILYKGVLRQDTDGLNNVKYELVDKKMLPLYTWFYVKVQP